MRWRGVAWTCRAALAALCWRRLCMLVPRRSCGGWWTKERMGRAGGAAWQRLWSRWVGLQVEFLSGCMLVHCVPHNRCWSWLPVSQLAPALSLRLCFPPFIHIEGMASQLAPGALPDAC